jgi:hypothetical protein
MGAGERPGTLVLVPRCAVYRTSWMMACSSDSELYFGRNLQSRRGAPAGIGAPCRTTLCPVRERQALGSNCSNSPLPARDCIRQEGQHYIKPPPAPELILPILHHSLSLSLPLSLPEVSPNRSPITITHAHCHTQSYAFLVPKTSPSPAAD